MKAMREKVKRDSKKIEDEPAEYANEEKKTTTEEIVEVSNKIFHDNTIKS